MARALVLNTLALILFSIVGPSRGGEGPKFDVSDAEVAKIVASGRRVPKGFLSEELKAESKEAITVNWIRRLKSDERRVVLVAAASAEDAQKWTQVFLDKSNVPVDAKKIVAVEKTKAYYQFKTKYQSGATTYWTYHRVWRNNFFRPGDDLGGRYLGQRGTFQVGTLTGRRDAETVLWLAEFLWWNDHQNTPGTFVVATPITWEDKTAFAFKVALLTAEVIKGDFGVPDTTRLIRWELSVDRDNGQVSQTIREIQEIKGKKA
jgi:hypothetical protein